LNGIKSKAIEVERTFADFDDFWNTVLGGAERWTDPGVHERGGSLSILGIA
jgi:hypothetical protein